MYGLDPLTLWVDWYLWPADLPVPRDARLLRGQGVQGDLDLKQALDNVGRDTLETPPATQRPSHRGLRPVVAGP